MCHDCMNLCSAKPGVGEGNVGMGCSEYLDCGNLGSCITGILPSCYDGQGVHLGRRLLFLLCFFAVLRYHVRDCNSTVYLAFPSRRCKCRDAAFLYFRQVPMPMDAPYMLPVWITT